MCVYIWRGCSLFFLSKTKVRNLEQTGNGYEWVRKGTGDRQHKSAVEGACGEVDLQQS